MYSSFTDIRGLEVVGRDAEHLGRINDMYVDTRDWHVGYVVVEAGEWLSSNEVLIPVELAGHLSPERSKLVTDLRSQDIASAASADSVRTVKDQNEGGGWRLPGPMRQFLLGNPGVVFPASLHEPVAGAQAISAVDTADERPPRVSEEERHLRSAKEIIGYSLSGADDEVGSVQDLLIKRDDWSLAWLSIDTGHWLPGRLVIVAPKWAKDISWEARTLSVSLTRDQVRQSPALAELDGLDTEYVNGLAAFYRLGPF